MKHLPRRLLLFAAAAATIAALVYAFLPGPVEVEAAPVDRGPLEESVREDGKTRIKDRYVVSSPLAGKLERIRLREGDEIGYLRRPYGAASSKSAT